MWLADRSRRWFEYSLASKGLPDRLVRGPEPQKLCLWDLLRACGKWFARYQRGSEAVAAVQLNGQSMPLAPRKTRGNPAEPINPIDLFTIPKHKNELQYVELEIFPGDFCAATHDQRSLGCNNDLLENPDTRPPRTSEELHQSRKMISPSVIIYFYDFGLRKELNNFVRLFISFTQPDNYSRSFSIDVSHVSNLGALLLVVSLVDTYCIDPESSWLEFGPKMSQRAAKIGRDANRCTVKPECVSFFRCAPDVWQCFERSIVILSLSKGQCL